MTSRVLIADDSLTIQKVIGITLASSGYELTECLTEADLLTKIETKQFDLVLLDFNLSDSRLGYDLAKEISRSMPNAAIIAMLGTFDTIDDSQFKTCGITDKIVKPFESAKFIKKCHDLLEEKRLPFAMTNKEVAPIEISSITEDDLDEWRVDAPKMQTNDFSNDTSNVLDSQNANEGALDPLSSEIEGWGFSSNNSLEEKFQKTFPPVIEEMSDIDFIPELIISPEVVAKANFTLPDNINFNLFTEEEVELEATSENFWAVDEVIYKMTEEEVEIEEDEEVKIEIKAEEVFTPKANSKAKSKNVPALDEDVIVEKLKHVMQPIIEEMVKKYCLQSAEKVAWEVIPDLAENLIRKEIKDISDSIKH